MEWYSQFGQDRYVYETFAAGKKGVFCDVGAHDGVSISNTYALEKLGWTGLCVEAHPRVFPRLRANRACVCVEGAAHNYDGTATFLMNEGYTEMLSGVADAYEDAHRARIAREQAERGGGGAQVAVPCYRLASLFREHGITTVDYLSIDTEGTELEVLQGIDFAACKVNLVDVEVNYPGSPKHEAIKALLAKEGFVFHHACVIDHFYVSGSPRWSWEQ